MHSQISMLCDLMSWKKIKTYDYFITKPSLQDGHGCVDTQCKEKTFSRSDHRSRIRCRIPGGTKIGPVIDIKVVQIIGVHGIEIAVPSMRDHSRTSWILITRGKSILRRSGRSQCQSSCSQFQPAQTTSRTKRSKYCRKGLSELLATEQRPKPVELEQNRTESCSTQSESNVLHEENHGYSEKNVEDNSKISMVLLAFSLIANIEDGVKLLRYFDQDERETDGAVHGDTIRPKLLKGFWENDAEEFK